MHNKICEYLDVLFEKNNNSDNEFVHAIISSFNKIFSSIITRQNGRLKYCVLETCSHTDVKNYKYSNELLKNVSDKSFVIFKEFLNEITKNQDVYPQNIEISQLEQKSIYTDMFKASMSYPLLYNNNIIGHFFIFSASKEIFDDIELVHLYFVASLLEDLIKETLYNLEKALNL